MVHFFLGLTDPRGVPHRLPALARSRPGSSGFPSSFSCSWCSTTALALFLSALTVHYRDIRDLLSNLLMFWFFATPIIYPWQDENVLALQTLFDLNPFTHLAVLVSGDSVFRRTGRPCEMAAGPRRRFGRAVPGGILVLRSVARLVCRSRMSSHAIELSGVSKIYRRYGGRQFATLKSALLQRSILRDLRPERNLSGA